jgi:putative spermidine/putrescine transport system permease protein
MSRAAGRLYLLKLLVAAILLFILSPMIVVIISSFGAASFLYFPPHSYSIKWYYEIFELDGLGEALANSLLISGIATPVSIVLGTTSALAIARYKFAGKSALMAMLLSPLVVPAIVIGIAMLQFFRSIDGLSTLQAMIAAHVAITLPYMVRTVVASLEMEDESMLEAAKMLGANAFQSFAFVTLPTIKSSIFTGAIFVFIISFDNYAISMFLSDAGTTTLPIKMLEFIESRTDPAMAALASLLIAFSVILLCISTWAVGLKRVARMSGG